MPTASFFEKEGSCHAGMALALVVPGAIILVDVRPPPQTLKHILMRLETLTLVFYWLLSSQHRCEGVSEKCTIKQFQDIFPNFFCLCKIWNSKGNWETQVYKPSLLLAPLPPPTFANPNFEEETGWHPWMLCAKLPILLLVLHAHAANFVPHSTSMLERVGGESTPSFCQEGSLACLSQVQALVLLGATLTCGLVWRQCLVSATSWWQRRQEQGGPLGPGKPKTPLGSHKGAGALLTVLGMRGQRSWGAGAAAAGGELSDIMGTWGGSGGKEVASQPAALLALKELCLATAAAKEKAVSVSFLGLPGQGWILGGEREK